MGKTTSCVKEKVKRGPWSPDEDQKLVLYIKKHGHGSWRSLPKNAGLLRCGKSCRLRWLNYLHPDIKRGPFAPEEQATIIQLQGMLGNKWASIASHLPGRTDNEIKNFWNTHLRKRLCSMGRTLQTQLSPFSAEPSIVKSESPSTHHMVQWESLKLGAEACLSMQSSLLYSPLPGKTDCDIFLQFWNSEVGERFRKIPRKDGVACQNPISLTSSSIKVESGSVVTVQSRPAGTNTSADSAHEQEDSRRPDVDMMACSVSTTSNDFADSSDTALKLLLDFPGGNDMEFLQGQTDAFSNFLDLGCD